jgi:hypothetical protein
VERESGLEPPIISPRIVSDPTVFGFEVEDRDKRLAEASAGSAEADDNPDCTTPSAIFRSFASMFEQPSVPFALGDTWECSRTEWYHILCHCVYR